mmetsp:Transcript_10239/g.18668  ORF Transcript_10239/g.18668 Transcript_10239/m.18668 type:complete len:182 (-) Transcript_10239:356-901(-)|eukprot:CAMPEP_0197519074 /NCGR_PEP_ID=MMETSP1318-20131121/4328_1 /TAXON_ID=552666 /ORGANISM="Partenskyella glossopodia, Strain RCC365" /LENGTH=181 /DNA_ID=CAMNT_0043069843 /DNA_START=301 /DNA_END=846 /DNA_ORIENTATION=-
MKNDEMLLKGRDERKDGRNTYGDVMRREGKMDAQTSSRIARIRDGFKIVNMEMSDAESGEVLWQSSDWNDMFERELEATVPQAILEAKAVARTMKFSSVEEIRKFRLVQTVLLHGQPIEVWEFKVGLVIPGTTNSWQCVIESAGKDQMIPVHILSGNTMIDTKFFDGDKFIGRVTLKLDYE